MNPTLTRVTVAVSAVLVTSACAAGAPRSTPPAPHAKASAAADRSAQVATAPTAPAASQSPAAADRKAPVAAPFRHALPGMPPVQEGHVYAATRAGNVQPRIAPDPAYLYVPNSFGAPITTVISQRTHKVVRVLHTGSMSQHVTPSYDLNTLYVEASVANQLVAINPRTGRIEKKIRQKRPYNLYFTPDGKQAIEMAEQDDEVIFENPHSFKRIAMIHDRSCDGPNHADFSANGRYFLVTCEFSGSLLKISTTTDKVVGRLKLPSGSKPQDVRLSPTGRVFYVADMDRNKLLRVGWRKLRVIGHTDLPSMPHGIYPSRNGKLLYVSDRGAGKVSVVSVATNKVVDTWTVPGGGSPDMGGLSADGKTLWLAGRYDGEVYGWNTRTGKLIARIHVGGSPHGILVWPQPGRYSLGHTGNMR